MQLEVVWGLTVYTLLKEYMPLFDFLYHWSKGVSTSESRSFWTWERNFGVKMFHCGTNRKTLYTGTKKTVTSEIFHQKFLSGCLVIFPLY